MKSAREGHQSWLIISGDQNSLVSFVKPCQTGIITSLKDIYFCLDTGLHSLFSCISIDDSNESQRISLLRISFVHLHIQQWTPK